VVPAESFDTGNEKRANSAFTSTANLYALTFLPHRRRLYYVAFLHFQELTLEFFVDGSDPFAGT